MNGFLCARRCNAVKITGSIVAKQNDQIRCCSFNRVFYNVCCFFLRLVRILRIRYEQDFEFAVLVKSQFHIFYAVRLLLRAQGANP